MSRRKKSTKGSIRVSCIMCKYKTTRKTKPGTTYTCSKCKSPSYNWYRV